MRLYFSAKIRQIIKRGDIVLADILVKVAFISKKTKKPQKLPDEIKSVLSL